VYTARYFLKIRLQDSLWFSKVLELQNFARPKSTYEEAIWTLE